MTDLADADLFKCEQCGATSDIENSVKRGEQYLCELCAELPHVGDRIELVALGRETDGRPDPAPMTPGSRGTVRRVVQIIGDLHQIAVDWDPEVGRSLCLVTPPDEFRIVERAMD